MRLQLKKEWVIPTVVGVVSFAGGVAAGYILQINKHMKMIRENLEEIRSDQVERDFKEDNQYRTFNKMIQEAATVTSRFAEDGQRYLNKFFEMDTPKEELEPDEEPDEDEFEDEFKEEYEEPVEPPVPGERVVTMDDGGRVINIFPQDDDDWKWELELDARRANPGKPYILHRDEYYHNEDDLDQVTITYYEGDSILTDDGDVPVYDPEKIVGQLAFGHGSGDPNICYVRNDKLGVEYEVLRDRGYYQVEVLGEEMATDIERKDLKHSITKFRDLE